MTQSTASSVDFPRARYLLKAADGKSDDLAAVTAHVASLLREHGLLCATAAEEGYVVVSADPGKIKAQVKLPGLKGGSVFVVIGLHRVSLASVDLMTYTSFL